MTLDKLCNLLELPEEVCSAVKEYQASNTFVFDEALRKKCSQRETWDQAVKELQERIGEDPFGFSILSEMLLCVCDTYKEYQKLNIPDSIFTETMKFCTRFICEHKRLYGHYAFTWAWWFPRQIFMQEFRIGAFEFEFITTGKEKKISIHIPADADMTNTSMSSTFSTYRNFLQTYFPSWLTADWYCESWLLSPALKNLLPKTSHILTFQTYFTIESTDYESLAVLDWVYPGEKPDLPSLSEHTSLQKQMKKFLLSGGKIGWTKGKFLQLYTDRSYDLV